MNMMSFSSPEVGRPVLLLAYASSSLSCLPLTDVGIITVGVGGFEDFPHYFYSIISE